jgi:ATP-dependent 26S proteasome regulatory subunit
LVALFLSLIIDHSENRKSLFQNQFDQVQKSVDQNSVVQKLVDYMSVDYKSVDQNSVIIQSSVNQKLIFTCVCFVCKETFSGLDSVAKCPQNHIICSKCISRF